MRHCRSTDFKHRFGSASWFCITAAASLAAGKKIVTRADLDAAVLLAEDPVVGGVSFQQNQLLISEEPGLGITEILGWKPV